MTETEKVLREMAKRLDMEWGPDRASRKVLDVCYQMVREAESSEGLQTSAPLLGGSQVFRRRTEEKLF
jgi:hypothetical protein